MSRPRPETLCDEPALDGRALLGRQLLPLALLVERAVLQILERLLLVVCAHLEHKGDDKGEGEDGVGDVERDAGNLGVRGLEAREGREVGRRGEVAGQEEVLGEFGGEEEEVLGKGDEEEVEEREGELWERFADEGPPVVL